MKEYFLKNLKHKAAVFVICAAVYLVLIILSAFTPLGKTYTFEWTFRHLYFLNWIPAVVFIIFDKLPLSLAITAGNFAGVFLGEFLGGFMEESYVKSKITPDMTELEAAAICGPNYSWAIWAVTVLCFTVAGVIYTVGRFGRL